MQPTDQNFADAYRDLSEKDIAVLFSQIDTLTGPAQIALDLEIERRGLSASQLSKMRAAELRHEALFDRLQKQRRKNLAWYFLTRNDPKGLIAVLLILLVFILISALMTHLH